MKLLMATILSVLLGSATLAVPAHAEEVPVTGEKAQKVQADAGKPAWANGWRSQGEPVEQAGYTMVFGLAFCLALLCGGVWVAKRFGLVKVPGKNAGLRVLERTPVSPKTTICLVEARGKQFLISVGSERVSLISSMSVGDSVESDESFEEFICDSSQPVTAC